MDGGCFFRFSKLSEDVAKIIKIVERIETNGFEKKLCSPF